LRNILERFREFQELFPGNPEFFKILDSGAAVPKNETIRVRLRGEQATLPSQACSTGGKGGRRKCIADCIPRVDFVDAHASLQCTNCCIK
jgi:hypothetical protein